MEIVSDFIITKLPKAVNKKKKKEEEGNIKNNKCKVNFFKQLGRSRNTPILAQQENCKKAPFLV